MLLLICSVGRFYNLKPEKAMNSLLSTERADLWTPILIMDNTEKKLETLNDGATFIEVCLILLGLQSLHEK